MRHALGSFLSNFLLAVVLSTFLMSLPDRSGALEPTPAQHFDRALAGHYDVFGKNPDGSLYDGTVSIQEASGVYRFDWLISNGEQFHGEGFLLQERLVVHWGAPHPVIYTLVREGVLRGVWSDGTATETLVKK